MRCPAARCWPTVRQRRHQTPATSASNAPAASLRRRRRSRAGWWSTHLRTLRTLLLRNLDLARARRDSRGAEAPDETEWLRLIAAAPAQVRELLETEGYFDRRSPGAARARAAVGGARARRARAARASQRGDAVGARRAARARRRRRRRRARHRSRRCTPGGRCRRATPSATPIGRGQERRAGAAARAPAMRPPASAQHRRQVDADDQPGAACTSRSTAARCSALGELHIDRPVAHDEETVRNLARLQPRRAADRGAAARLPGAAAQSRACSTPSSSASTRPGQGRCRAGDRARCTSCRCSSLTLGVGISANTGPARDRRAHASAHLRLRDHAA